MISGSHKILLYLFISFFISGIIDGAFPQSEGAFYLVHTLIIAVLLFSWCGKHAEESGITPPSGAKLLCGLIGIIGVPVYLFRAFGFKKGGIKCLIGIAVTIIILAIYVLAFYLTETALRLAK